MVTSRFIKLSQMACLVWWGLCALASHAGTISITPTLADGGTTGINVTSYTKLYYRITNTGSSNLVVSNVLSASVEFSIEQPPALWLPLTIPPGASYLVSALFKPTTAGARNGTIVIISDDPMTPSFTVTATGYGGIEQSIRLAPAVPFEIEINQGMDLRANVTFDNGASGFASLNWSSSNPVVAEVVTGDNSVFLGTPVPTGQLTTRGLGTSTLTVAGVNNPSAKATVNVTVVPASNFEFMATAVPDRIVRVKNGAWSLCYDFPEVDVNNRPAYSTNQISVTTVDGQIGNVYVTAKLANGTAAPSEEVFYLTGCNQRATVFSPPLSVAFRDLAVDSGGSAVASTDSGLWRISLLAGIYQIPLVGIVPDDIGALAFDTYDSLYAASYLQTTTTRAAAIYKQPYGTTSWVPIATVVNGLIPASQGILGMAVDSTKAKLAVYLMKNSQSLDRALIDRYSDLNGDGSFFKLIGSTIVADPGEIAEVAAIDAGLGLTIDPNANLIASVAANDGSTIVRLVDKNNNGDFKDPDELKVIYQSTMFSQLKDVAFASLCSRLPPTPVIYRFPIDGVADIGESIFLVVSGSSRICDSVKFTWRDETQKLICSTTTCEYVCAGRPALHTITLDVTGSSGTQLITVKCGPPKIYGVWPGSGVTNSAVFLFGKNFQTVSGVNPIVKFNNGTLAAPIVQVAAPDMLFVLQPPGVTAGYIEICTAIGCAKSPPYNSPTPGIKIFGFWPVEVKVGELLFVFGQSFSLQGVNKISVNGQLVPIVQPLDSTLLMIMVPPGASTGQVCITVPGYLPVCSPTPVVILP